MIAVMSRYRLHVLLGRVALLGIVELAVTVPGCGDGTSAHDAAAATDASSDPPAEFSTAETASQPADAPAVPIQDAATTSPADTSPPDVARIGEAGAEASPIAVDALRGPDTASVDAIAPIDAPAGSPEVAEAGRAIDTFVDPVCASADSSGFFAACTSCSDPGNCDSVTVGSRTRKACGCQGSGDCPCGLTCGCSTIAPSVQVCGICTR